MIELCPLPVLLAYPPVQLAWHSLHGPWTLRRCQVFEYVLSTGHGLLSMGLEVGTANGLREGQSPWLWVDCRSQMSHLVTFRTDT
jgi:hypothetical protein